MDPEITYAIEAGIQSFLASSECHDLAIADVIVTSLSSFLASTPAIVVVEYFKRPKGIFKREAKKVGEDLSRLRLNETKIGFGLDYFLEPSFR